MQALFSVLVGGLEPEEVYHGQPKAKRPNMDDADGGESFEAFTTPLAETWKQLHSRSLQQADRDDDAQFLLDLFYGPLRHRAEFEALIAPKLEHWDLERIAWVDRVLLLMGIYEMLHCQDIPVKVSINEYIDIAKEYSTDKSSQFVNGILDAIHIDLINGDRIHKIGRGQIS